MRLWDPVSGRALGTCAMPCAIQTIHAASDGHLAVGHGNDRAVLHLAVPSGATA